MGKIVMKLVLLLAILSLSSCKTSLSGIVESSGNIVTTTDASINLTNLQDGRATAFLTTIAQDGKFEFPQNLPKGTYLLEALVPGFELYSVRIDIEKSRKVKLQLVPLGDLKSKSFQAGARIDSSRGEGGAKINPPKL